MFFFFKRSKCVHYIIKISFFLLHFMDFTEVVYTKRKDIFLKKNNMHSAIFIIGVKKYLRLLGSSFPRKLELNVSLSIKVFFRAFGD